MRDAVSKGETPISLNQLFKGVVTSANRMNVYNAAISLAEEAESIVVYTDLGVTKDMEKLFVQGKMVARKIHWRKNRSSLPEDKEVKAMFEEARKEYYGVKRGLDIEFGNFKKHKDYQEVVRLLLPAIKKQAKSRELMKQKGEFTPIAKHFQGWITSRRWEDVVTIEQGERATKKW